MKIVSLATITLALGLAPLTAQTDTGWPREVDANGRHFTIYQPKVDRWENDHLEARAVVTVTASAANRQSELLKAIRDSLPNWPRTVSLNRLLADLAITQNETGIESIPLNKHLECISAVLVQDLSRLSPTDVADLRHYQCRGCMKIYPLSGRQSRMIPSRHTTDSMHMAAVGDLTSHPWLSWEDELDSQPDRQPATASLISVARVSP